MNAPQLSLLGGLFFAICFFRSQVKRAAPKYLIHNQTKCDNYRIFYPRRTKSSFLQIYHAPLRPASWLAVLVSIFVFGTVLLVMVRFSSSLNDTRFNIFLSFIFVFLAYISKRLPAMPDSSTSSVHLAIAVISFAGFVLFSIYRCDSTRL